MARELRSKWFLLIPIIATLYTIWVILLALGKTLGVAEAFELFGFQQWLYLGSAIFIILIVIMIMWMAPPKKVEVAEEEEEELVTEEKPPVVIEAEPPTELPKEIISYPAEVEGAIYADTLVELAYNTTLNLRTFLGRSCLLCPEQALCLEKYKEKLTRESFLASVECFKTKMKELRK